MLQYIIFTISFCLIGSVPVALVMIPTLIERYKRYRQWKKLAKLTRLSQQIGNYFGDKDKPN